MSVVFVTNKDTNCDYELVKKYGTLTFLTTGKVLRDGSVPHRLLDQLVNSKVHDCLCMTGDAAISGLALVMWLQMHGEAKIISFDETGPDIDFVYRRDIRMMVEQRIDRLQPPR